MPKKVKELTLENIYEYMTPYAQCVGSTYGPNGANVLIDAGGTKMITKDGVTVSNSLEYKDPAQQLVVDILKGAAQETVSKVGDGTTSTVIMSYSLIKNLKQKTGYNELRLKKVIDAFSHKLESHIRSYGAKQTPTVEDVKNVINISTNGDKQLTQCIYDSIMHAGVGGHVVIKDSPTQDSFVELKEGYEMPSGYYGPTFVNNSAEDCIDMHDPLILVTDLIIEDVADIKKIASFVDRAKRGLFIIADDVREEALAWLLLNAEHGRPVGVAKAPSYGLNRKELLQDLAVSIGAKFISSTSYMSLKDIKLDDLGTCRLLRSFGKKTTFQECHSDVKTIMGRMEQLKARILATTDQNEVERLQDRISRLSSSVANLYVGGLNPTERLERKHRVDDAIEAVKSVERLGVSPGAGVFYAHLAINYMPTFIQEVKEEFPPIYKEMIEDVGEAIANSLWAPSEKLNALAMVSSKARLDDCKEQMKENLKESMEGKFIGTNYETGELVDLMKGGIVEPTELCMNVICNSLSAVGILCTVKFVNYSEED